MRKDTLMDEYHEKLYKQFNSEFIKSFIKEINSLLEDKKSPFLREAFEPLRRDKREAMAEKMSTVILKRQGNGEADVSAELVDVAIDFSTPLEEPSSLMGGNGNPPASTEKLLHQIKGQLHRLAAPLPDKENEAVLKADLELRQQALNAAFELTAQFNGRYEAFMNKTPKPEYDQNTFRMLENARGILDRFEVLTVEANSEAVELFDIAEEKSKYQSSREEYINAQNGLKQEIDKIKDKNIEIHLGNLEGKTPPEDVTVTTEDILTDVRFASAANLGTMEKKLAEAEDKLHGDKARELEKLSLARLAAQKKVSEQYTRDINDIREEYKKYQEEYTLLEDRLLHYERLEDTEAYKTFVLSTEAFEKHRNDFEGKINTEMFKSLLAEKPEKWLKEDDIGFYDSELEKVNTRLNELNEKLNSQMQDTEEASESLKQAQISESLQAEIDNIITKSQFENSLVAMKIKEILEDRQEHENKSFDIKEMAENASEVFCNKKLVELKDSATEIKDALDNACEDFSLAFKSRQNHSLSSNWSMVKDSLEKLIVEEKKLNDQLDKFKEKHKGELPWNTDAVTDETLITQKSLITLNEAMNMKPIKLDVIAEKTVSIAAKTEKYKESIKQKIEGIGNVREKDKLVKGLNKCMERAEKIQSSIGLIVDAAKSVTELKKSYNGKMRAIFGEMAKARQMLNFQINDAEERRQTLADSVRREKNDDATAGLKIEKQRKIEGQNKTLFEIQFLESVKDMLEKGRAWYSVKLNDKRFEDKKQLDECKARLAECDKKISQKEAQRDSELNRIEANEAKQHQALDSTYNAKEQELARQRNGINAFKVIATPIIKKADTLEKAAKQLDADNITLGIKVDNALRGFNGIKKEAMEKLDAVDNAAILKLLQTKKKFGTDSVYFNNIKSAIKDYTEASKQRANGELNAAEWQSRTDNLLEALKAYEQKRDVGFEKKKTPEGQRRLDLVKQLKESIASRTEQLKVFDKIKENLVASTPAFVEPKTRLEVNIVTSEASKIKNVVDASQKQAATEILAANEVKPRQAYQPQAH